MYDMFMNLSIGQRLVAIYIISFIVIAPIFVIVVRARKKKKDVSGFLAKEMKNFPKYAKQYTFYSENFFFRDRYMHLDKLYSMRGEYTKDEVIILAVSEIRTMLMQLGIALVVFALAFNSLIIVLAALILFFVYSFLKIEKRYDTQYLEYIKDLREFVRDFSDRYKNTPDIAKALDELKSSSDLSSYFQEPVSNLHRILTRSINKDADLTLLLDANKEPILRSLLQTLYIQNDNVTTESASDYSLAPVEKALSMFVSVIDEQIHRCTESRDSFKPFGIIIILPVPLMIPIMMSNTRLFPATAVLYNGTYGLIAQIALLLSTGICYYYLIQCSRHKIVDKEDRNTFLRQLAEKKFMKRLIIKVRTRNKTKQDKLTAKLVKALSDKDYKYVYTSRIVLSTTFFILFSILIFVIPPVQKHNLYNYYGPFGAEPAIEVAEDMLPMMEQMDATVLGLSSIPTYEQIEEATYKVNGRLDETFVNNNTNRLLTKYTKYHKLGVKPIYALIPIIFGLLGWFIEDILLAIRASLVKYQIYEDILQIQTVMCIMSDTVFDSFTILNWLYYQTDCLRHNISQCIYAYNKDPEEALYNLWASSTYVNFKRSVKDLTLVYTTSSPKKVLVSSYPSRKTFSDEIHRLLLKDIKDRTGTCKLICWIPTAILLIFLFLGPMLIVSLSALFSMAGGM